MGRKVIDLTGMRFNNLVVLKKDSSVIGGTGISIKWIVECDCGERKSVTSHSLRNQNRLSCGCRQGAKEGISTHIPKRVYWTWQNMMRRCYRPTSEKDKRNYMDRGIKVCDRWHDPRNYYIDMGDKPFDNATIDRIDNEGDYNLSNVRWATWEEQNNNRRDFVRRV